MHVADLGSGSGHYSLAAARLLGGGRVFAIDVQKGLLDKLKDEAVKAHLSNIDIVWGDLEKMGGTRLKDGSVDVAIVANLLFQIGHKDHFLAEVKRILKSKGKIVVVDWTDSFGGLGPQSNMLVPELAAKELFEKAGFTSDGSIMAGSHHYGLIFKKP